MEIGEVSVKCSWKIDAGCHNLKKLFRFSTVDTPELEAIVEAETCVHLCSDDSSQGPCSLQVKLDSLSQFVITKVTTVSEARIIECYCGHCEEYNGTLHSEFLDDFEGCAAYTAYRTIPPSEEITLKFARMKHDKCMWVYGVHLTVRQVTAPQVKIGGINLANVNEILKESSRPISDKAEQYKKFLQQQSGDPQTVLRMLEGEYLKPLGDTSRSMARFIAGFCPHLVSRKQSTTTDQPETTITTTSLPPQFSSCDKDLKEYIDKRLGQLEAATERLEEKLRVLEKVQSEKMDTIIRLLEGITKRTN